VSLIAAADSDRSIPSSRKNVSSESAGMVRLVAARKLPLQGSSYRLVILFGFQSAALARGCCTGTGCSAVVGSSTGELSAGGVSSGPGFGVEAGGSA
jgi:hypothetical protein